MRRALLGLAGLVAAAAVIAVAPRDARACGGCFHPPSQSGDVITDERMGFVVTPQQTTLYDEINYQGNPASFAWVLPIHGQVTVGLSADIAFQALDAATQTTIVAPNLPPCASCQCGSFNAGTAAPTGGGSGSSSGGGVTVIAQQTVGPYDTVQLSSTNPNALNAWLTANGYVIPADIQPVLDAYVSEGFNFLALRLAPGQGVNAMRPVRVTSTGAGLSLPLRMVAAGTGATVGITIWVLADGRYEPQNAKTFTVDPSTLVWDWSAGASNYTTVVAQEEALFNNAAWQIESSLDVLPTQVEGTILADDPTQDYLPTGGDSDAGDGGPGESADQVRQDDLAALFPGGENTSVRITRFRGDIARAALSSDLVLQASADQSPMSNVYQVTKSVNAPTCPAVPNPCPCGASGSSGGFGGGLFGESSSGGSTSGGGSSSGCTTAPANSQESDSGIPIILAGLAGAAVFLNRRKRP
jgi:uncharacterized membrane protein YgcG